MTKENDEQRRQLETLQKMMASGRIKFSDSLRDNLGKSLQQVRYDSAGRIDLSTVGPDVRALALATTAMSDREELKSSISLRDIQNAYFRLLETAFADLHKEMIRHGFTPQQMGEGVARHAPTLKAMTPSLRHFIEVVDEFWTNLSEAGHAHVEDLPGSKGVFGGDLFPQKSSNLASRCGIYLDTLVLPDPFLKISRTLSLLPDSRWARFVVKYGLTVLSYRELALADVSPPIVVVLPDRSILETAEREMLNYVAEPDIVAHFNRLFGTKLASFSETTEFAKTIVDENELLTRVANPQRLLFDSEWSGPLSDQLRRFLEDEPLHRQLSDGPGELVLFQVLGRMHQANDLLHRSHRLSGTPLIDAPTSWQYFRWKLEYDAAHSSTVDPGDLHVTRALLDASSSSGELQWLGNVPPEALIEIRQSGALPELRSLLGDGIDRLTSINPDDFTRSGELLIANMKLAFSEHSAALDMLGRKKWKFAAWDIGSWVATGAVEVAAVMTGSTSYGLAALAANRLLGAPTLSELPAKVKTLVEESAKLKRSPVGLLFQHQKGSGT